MEGTIAEPSGWTRRRLLGAAPALAAAACAPAGPPPLRLWAMSYEGDYSPHLMGAFTAATGVPVEVQSLPWTAAHEKLLTARAGAALPDVMMLPNGWVPEFAMIGAIAEVTDARLLGAMFPGVAATVAYRGRPHAVPWSVAPIMQFYRRDLLARAGYDRPPEDWTGWRAMGRRLKAAAPDDFAFLMLLNWWDVLFTFLGQTGAHPLRERDTRGAFRQPAIRAALAYYVSLFDEGLAPRVLSTEVQDPLASFAHGYFAVFPYAPSLLLDLHRRAGIIARDRWAVARMPGPRGPGPVSAVSACLAVSRETDRPEAAWALVRHLTSTPSELRLQRLIGNLPARADAWDSPQMRAPALRPMAEQMRYPAPGPGIVEWERIRIEVQLVAERVVRHDIGIDDGLAEMDRRADDLLAKRRALIAAGRIA